MNSPLSKFTLKEIEEELKLRGQRLDKRYPITKKEIEVIINEWKKRNPNFVQSLLKFVSLDKLIEQQINSNGHDDGRENDEPLSYQYDDEDYMEEVEGKELKKVKFRKPGYDENYNNGFGYYEDVKEYFYNMWNRWCMVEHGD